MRIILSVICKVEKGAFEDTPYGVIEVGILYFTESLANTNSFIATLFHDLLNYIFVQKKHFY